MFLTITVVNFITGCISCLVALSDAQIVAQTLIRRPDTRLACLWCGVSLMHVLRGVCSCVCAGFSCTAGVEHPRISLILHRLIYGDRGDRLAKGA